MSSGAHNEQVICKRTCKYSIFRMACFSIAQGCKILVVHSQSATKNLSLHYKMAARLIFTPAVSVLHDVG